MLVVCVVLLCVAACAADSSKEYRAFYRYFDQEAPPSRLRRRFRQLALEFHPDHQKPGTDKAAAQRKFLLLTTAYEKLLARSRREDPDEEARARATRAAAEERQRAEARRKSEERARETARRRREAEEAAAEAAQRAREEEARREMEEERRELEEERVTMSRMLELLFVAALSAATVLGVGVSYYFFALRDEVLLIDQRRAEEAAERPQPIPLPQESVLPVVENPPPAPPNVIAYVPNTRMESNAQDETQVESVSAIETSRDVAPPPPWPLRQSRLPALQPMRATPAVLVAKRAAKRPGNVTRRRSAKVARPKRERDLEEDPLPEKDAEKKARL